MAMSACARYAFFDIMLFFFSLPSFAFAASFSSPCHVIFFRRFARYATLHFAAFFAIYSSIIFADDARRRHFHDDVISMRLPFLMPPLPLIFA